jgi:hypothetical protein
MFIELFVLQVLVKQSKLTEQPVPVQIDYIPVTPLEHGFVEHL